MDLRSGLMAWPRLQDLQSRALAPHVVPTNPTNPSPQRRTKFMAAV